MQRSVVTTGVYGFTEEEFFRAIEAAGVDVFCDIRARRGLRGSLYAFANSARLQERLERMGIKYIHAKELAPPQVIRDLQAAEDALSGTAKRSRQQLGRAFIDAYNDCCLESFDPDAFLERAGEDARTLCLFCVEARPDACHRSLVAGRLASHFGVTVTHILP